MDKYSYNYGRSIADPLSLIASANPPDLLRFMHTALQKLKLSAWASEKIEIIEGLQYQFRKIGYYGSDPFEDPTDFTILVLSALKDYSKKEASKQDSEFSQQLLNNVLKEYSIYLNKINLTNIIES